MTLSFAANYSAIVMKVDEQEHGISSIGVQILTSSEQAMIIYKDARLLDIILRTFTRKISEFRDDQRAQEPYWRLFTVFHDIKYMQRADCMPYCVS